eukprot:CAMPEP_0113509236 /NCGR_PEP_ID=MMETSP0014_2-20120614/37455_1 /TAXON_ID=2857 /ORGANISM="Nitzschia sp." /LENGTH=424 /DNA_ID=CAMNT_0000405027 /DNA_START=218 /DNA_END=1492 /DNA_ORIENTATION=+ /assembly_acc=CAM_ASM_000159
MPWLEKGNKEQEKNLLFVHVPRCGGTSLMKAHDVPHKAIEHAACHRRCGMRAFFRRYALLEKQNFPLYTEGNAFFLFVFIIGCFLLQIQDFHYRALAIFMIAFSAVMFTCLTFIFVAPTISRIRPIRRAYLIFVDHITCRFMESVEYVTGTNRHGYLNHLTAQKMLNYGYVSEEEMEDSSTLAIVRNPYARMVSVYMYNRMGPAESFQHFVKSWKKDAFKFYEQRREMEDWYTHSHAIPQFEYTHMFAEDSNKLEKQANSTDDSDSRDSSDAQQQPSATRRKDIEAGNSSDLKQVVHSIVKQEELKFLKKMHVESERAKLEEDEVQKMMNDCKSIQGLPKVIIDALLGMPHDNKRVTTKPWYQYYDQETLNLTYEMYHKDFEVFGYSAEMSQRPDLNMPPSVGGPMTPASIVSSDPPCSFEVDL